MIASFKRLQGLLSRPAHSYRPEIETFPDLDTQLLVEEMELKDNGNKRGQENLPPSDADGFDAVEREILEHIGAAQKRGRDQVETQIHSFDTRLSELDFEARFSDVKAISASGLSDLKSELQSGIMSLHGSRRDLTAAEEWMRSFKAEHKLQRPAKISSPTGTFLKWMLIFLLVVGELILNGELLSKHNTLGLVGGISIALIFSILNIGAALLLASFVIPYVLHRNWILKLWGLIGIVVFITFSFALNLSLAHYREVSGTLIDPDTGGLLIERIINQPFGLEEFRSWLLFVLGILFSIVALIDGLKLKDIYPGYATVDHTLRARRDEYREVYDEALQQLNEARTESEEDLRDARASLSRFRTEHDAIVAHRKRTVALFNDHQTQLEKAANALLQTYRDANISARSEPAPKHFSQAYRLDRISVEISSKDEWEADRLQASIKEAQTELDKLLRGLGKQFEDALARYRDLDVLVPDAS